MYTKNRSPFIPRAKIIANKRAKGNWINTDKIANIISKFHLKAKTNERISSFGSLKIIIKNWKENFEQTKEFINKSISKNDFSFIMRNIYNFIKNNEKIFLKRIRDNKIRECHGDIHSGNIFIADKIYIFDAII